MKLRVVNARTIDAAILDLLEKKGFDFLVFSITMTAAEIIKGYGTILEKILKS